MSRKRKVKKPEPQVFIDKKALQQVVEGLTALLMGVITGNDNLTTNKEIPTNEQSNNDSTDVT